MNIVPLSLYIHIPFCWRKCPYCDFNSYAFPTEFLEKQYIDALIEDLKAELSFVQERAIHSVFVGGGTPSLFSAESYGRLFRAISSYLSLDRMAEMTIEVNPGTVNLKKLNDYFSAGFNRLSIGVQSFNDQKLKKLHRIHHSREAVKAIEWANQAGFQHINIDLMYGLFEQTIEEALDDLTMAFRFSPAHLSWYQLTVEPKTPLACSSDRLTLPSEDVIAHIQKEGQRHLKSHHYIHYETSAYSQEGQYCQHNMNYWQFGDYLGIGAGASGKITMMNQKGDLLVTRYKKIPHPHHYLKQSQTKRFIAEKNRVKTKTLPFEFMMNALRLTKGVPIRLFEERTGLSREWIEPQVAQAISEGFLRKSSTHFQPTLRGQRFLNEGLLIFL